MAYYFCLLTLSHVLQISRVCHLFSCNCDVYCWQYNCIYLCIISVKILSYFTVFQLYASVRDNSHSNLTNPLLTLSLLALALAFLIRSLIVFNRVWQVFKMLIWKYTIIIKYCNMKKNVLYFMPSPAFFKNNIIYHCSC